MTNSIVHDSVKQYYGKVLKNTNDLKTNACLTCKRPSDSLKEILNQIHPAVLEKYYGCGLVAPTHLEGLRILDLGSGSGRDCFVLSKLVGENGHVIGVDMTDEQVNVAKEHVDYHTKQFGYSKPNVEFRKGYIEDLKAVGIDDASIDVVVSNCVVNLSPEKAQVFREIYRVLKPGGEFYFSDVYSDRRIPIELVQDSVLFGECLSGALYWNDFISMAKKTGFADPRIVETAPITVKNAQVEKQVGRIKFTSNTVRLFKIDELEPNCEDYGQAVMFTGGEDEFLLDNEHSFEAGKVEKVCGNTWLMLEKTRFKNLFKFYGDFGKHFGPYACNREKTLSNDQQSCCF